MFKNNIITAVIAIIATLPAGAQVQGTVDMKGAAGNENPFSADVKLQVKKDKITLKPFLGYDLMSKSSSAEKEEVEYTYPRTGNEYTSHTTQKSSGYALRYGLGIDYAISLRDMLSASLKANYTNIDTEKSRFETLSAPFSSAMAERVHSDILSPGTRTHDIETTLSYRHSTQRKGESWGLAYAFISNHSNLHQTMTSLLADHNNQQSTTIYDLSRARKTEEHSIAADWKRPVNEHHSFGIAVKYLKRLHMSDTRQLINTKETFSPFRHHMDNVGATIQYAFRSRLFCAQAQLGYEYTRMEKKDLYDFIPQVTMELNMTETDKLRAAFVRRIIRPGIEYLDTAKVIGPYTTDYGTADLEGIHANTLTLTYSKKCEKLTFNTTLTHFFTEDGFNAIWIENNNKRITFWGNQGVRRMWSLAPDVEWKAAKGTTLFGKVAVAWDKRIAYAINMAKEHWGITTSARLRQQLPTAITMQLFCDYSEGNTIDLYSHGGKMVKWGAELQRSFLSANRLTATLSFAHFQHPETVITQGQYIGSISLEPVEKYALSLKLGYRL